MSVDANAEFLEFRNVDKIKFIGTSSNTIIDTTTGRLGIGTDTPAYAIDVRGTANVTALSGITDFNFQPTSNTASIEYDSNVVTEFNRSKKLIKYPRVALTSASYNAYESGYKVTVSGFVNSSNYPWKAFNGIDYEVGMLLSGLNYDTNGNANTAGTTASRLSSSDSTPYGEWLKLELPNKIKLDKYVFTSRNDATNWTQGPEAGQVWGSNDDSNWTHLHTFTNSGFTGESRTVSFDVQTDNYYKYYAFIVTKTFAAGTDYYLCIPELKYYGLPEYDPDAAGVDVKVTSYPNVPNTDWLEVYYDAKNYTSGNNVQDETANNRDGVLYGNTSFSSADGKHKFDFDGSGDYIESLNITSISGNQTMSSSVWVKFTSWINTRYDFIYSLGDRTVSGNGTEYTLSVDHQTNGLYIGTNGLAGSVQFRFIPDLERWYHFATTYDGDTNRIFIDGTLRNSESLIGDLNLPTSGCDLVLGGDTASSRGQFMNGSIANFRLFNRAITSDEVWQLYAYQKEYFGHGDLGMTLKAGRLGIGTSKPEAVLDVRGDINVQGTITTFRHPYEPSYTLSTISPDIWAIAGESTARIGGGAISYTSGVSIKYHNGVPMWFFGSRDENVDILNTINHTTNTWSVAIAIAKKPESSGAFFNQITNNESYTGVNHRFSWGGNFSVDEFPNSQNGGNTGASYITIPDESVVFIKKTGTGTNQVYVYVNGGLVGQATNAETYAGSTPTKIRLGHRTRFSGYSPETPLHAGFAAVAVWDSAINFSDMSKYITYQSLTAK